MTARGDEMATWGGRRAGSGPKTAYPGKNLARPFAMDLTPTGREMLVRLQEKTGLSRSDILDHLIRTRGGDLTRPDHDERPLFPGKAQANVLSIRLTDDAGRILRRLKRETKLSYSDIGEALIRRFGRRTAFPKARTGQPRGSRQTDQ